MNFGEKYAVNRKGTSCLKYDSSIERKGRSDLIPLWVADMDFKLPEIVLEDMHERISHGIFGYTDPDEEYYKAVDRWFYKYHGYHVEKEDLTVGCGIVYGLATGIRAFTEVGDAVMVQKPVYYPFSEVIVDNGRKLINNQLHYEDYRYSIDYEDMEKKITENNVKAILFCSPHNPVGRVWSREELTRVADICLSHNVIMLVDEIHCDFIFEGHKFTSIMNLDEKYHKNLVLYTSPSKTFNVAGLQPANIIIKNEELRKKYRDSNARNGYSQGNVMAQIAVKSVYTKGDDWFKELLCYISENKEFMKSFVRENLKKAHLIEPDGTYLIWIDFSEYGYSNEELEHIISEEAGLWLDSGEIFSDETAQFQRFNIACKRELLERAMLQLKEAIALHIKWK